MQQAEQNRAARIIFWRARLPIVARLFAVVVLVTSIVLVGLSYYRLRHRDKPFRMRSEAAQLSTQVESIIEGYDHSITEDNRVRLRLRAQRDVAYQDGHHELEDVHLQVYPATGTRPDQISARKSVYDAANDQISFAGDVVIETRDSLIARTESVVYNRKSEIAETDVPLAFERENVRGRAGRATLDAKNKRLALRTDVEVIIEPEKQSGGDTSSSSSDSSGQKKSEAVKNQPQPVTIRAPQADFDQATLHVVFAGGATAEQNKDVMSGESLTAILSKEHRRLRQIEARTQAYLRTMTEGRAAEIQAADFDFFFDDKQQLQRAVALRDVRARTLDADAEMRIVGANSLCVEFAAQTAKSIVKEMHADGRSVVTLAASRSASADPRAAHKQLTADTVRLFWRATGRDLERAEAVGNAELMVDPVQQTATADRKTIYAPRFDCDFFETGNHARLFTATENAKAVIAPLQPSERRSVRTLTAKRIAVTFVRETQDVERMDAAGDASFNEQDRYARAAQAAYTAADEWVRLRGGEPVVWDSQARTKADEIDTDTRREISYARGRATTTYYSQAQTGGAAPFSKVKSPVFVGANTAEFHHIDGVGVYTGDARLWQDDNFVRANRLTLRHQGGRMEGEGAVQSALYQAQREGADGNRTVVPVFATATRMFYANSERVLHYEENVDIKQDTDRITGEAADVYLLKESNEVERTIVQRNVVLMQPGRRGAGSWAQYTAADETVVLKGAPARVEDAAQGTSESARLIVHLRENKIVADTKGEEQIHAAAGGRVRSTHRIRRQQQQQQR